MQNFHKNTHLDLYQMRELHETKFICLAHFTCYSSFSFALNKFVLLDATIICFIFIFIFYILVQFLFYSYFLYIHIYIYIYIYTSFQ